MCGIQLKDRRRSKNLMLMLDLNERIDQLATASSVHWYSHVLRLEDGHIWRKALVFEINGQRKKGRQNGTWTKQFDEESMKVGLIREDDL